MVGKHKKKNQTNKHILQCVQLNLPLSFTSVKRSPAQNGLFLALPTFFHYILKCVLLITRLLREVGRFWPENRLTTPIVWCSYSNWTVLSRSENRCVIERFLWHCGYHSTNYPIHLNEDIKEISTGAPFSKFRRNGQY